MKRIYFVALSALLLNSYEACSQQKAKIDKVVCIEFLEKYSEFWILDSSGKNGLRELLAVEFLKYCKFIGMKWDSVSILFGKPNLYMKRKDFLHRYRLNYFSESMREIGTLLLDIDVNDVGIITGFTIYTIDG